MIKEKDMKKVSNKTTFKDGSIYIILDWCEKPLIWLTAWENCTITLQECVDIAIERANKASFCGVKVYKSSMPSIIVMHRGLKEGAVYKRDYFEANNQYWRQIGTLSGYDEDCED
jgi:hypothetical protein